MLGTSKTILSNVCTSRNPYAQGSRHAAFGGYSTTDGGYSRSTQLCHTSYPVTPLPVFFTVMYDFHLSPL
jgi:hypothetical protein